jgi:hypothetical protein
MLFDVIDESTHALCISVSESDQVVGELYARGKDEAMMKERPDLRMIVQKANGDSALDELYSGLTEDSPLKACISLP